MDFGLYVRPYITYDKMLEATLMAEKLGYRGVYLNDHVHGFANEGKEDYLEAWTAMTGLGVQTSKIKVGQIVLFNSVRNPAFLAKSISALDQMTNGRYDLLIGSGWNEPEYVGYDLMEKGRGMPSVKERVDRFAESLQILNLMLSQEVTDFDGEFWKLKNAINMPQPVQKPFPLAVGCKGPRMMRLAVKYGTGINISTRGLSNVMQKITEFKLIHAEVAQNNTVTPLEKFEISGFTSLHLARNEAEKQDMLKSFSERSKTEIEEVEREQFIGTSEEIITKLNVLKEEGMKWIVAIPSLHKSNDANPIEYFYDNIMKQL